MRIRSRKNGSILAEHLSVARMLIGRASAATACGREPKRTGPPWASEMAELSIDLHSVARISSDGARERLREALRPLADTRHGLVNRDTGGFSIACRVHVARGIAPVRRKIDVGPLRQ
jgi:hypothetical protein